ncbi:MAG: hypothetical protein RMZ43_018645 [Nostoc sp. CmiVER01]|uniref:hypothetical protein n=1 Tax=Nostoc sp. CmiVER01 TaxID=3075384 RepID=UPI002AD20597|nr:hypothetical protein [Nostoc sp. CmiVER01]MDZ8126809.1 hypothetical protein [Nostoc sp. CmiVER01]
MPYLLLKTLISLHCGNLSKNLISNIPYSEVFKSIFRLYFRLAIAIRRAKQRHRSKEEMGNTIIPLGKSDERCSVMVEFEDACQDLFAQLLTDAPQWTEWMA